MTDLPEEAPTLEQVFPGIAKVGRDKITPELLSESGVADFTSSYLSATVHRKVDYDFENMRFIRERPAKLAKGDASINQCDASFVDYNSKLPVYLPQLHLGDRYAHKFVDPRYSPLYQAS